MAAVQPVYSTGFAQPPQPAGYVQPGYAAPGQGYGFAPPPGQQQQVAVVTQPMPLVIQSYHNSPVAITCPHCHAYVSTSLTYVTGALTWVMCIVLIVIGLSLGCCLIPFCLNDCKDVLHHCPNCKMHLGTFRRM